MSQITTTKRRLVSLLATLTLALSLMGIAPTAAFAGAVEGSTNSITVISDAATVTAGDQIDMRDYFDIIYTSGNHVDYLVTNGTGNASINKHNGTLTATTAGTVTVTAVITSGQQGNGSTGVCGGDSAIVLSDNKSVTINPSGNDYGYQGVTNTIMMTSPTVQSFSGDNTNGWVNQLGAISPANDGNYYFTIKMTNGFNSYNTPLLFASINGGNVVLMNANGTTQREILNTSNSGNLVVDAVNTTTKEVTIKVVASSIPAAGGQLWFTTGFRGNSANSTLGTTVKFVFTI